MDNPIVIGETLSFSGNAAHYLGHVLRLGAGAEVLLFNRSDGAFAARIMEVSKKTLQLTVESRLSPPEQAVGLTVCFAPIRGGRMETIIEKATELGADVLQPVFTQRSVVDKVNLERAEAIAREAAEQCERIGWPEIRPPVKLLTLLGDWPADMPLIYGDETGGGTPVTSLRGGEADAAIQRAEHAALSSGLPRYARNDEKKWAILAGPEGGFTPEEFAALRKVKSAQAVSLGPRILRADTAVITLCVATLMAWGDWHLAPRFEKD